MILYFSGTGNSRYVAQIIAEVTKDSMLSLNDLIKKENKETIYSDKPLVFVAPIYAWRIPRIVDTFIRKTKFTGNNKAYFIVTCGSEAGKAEDYIKKLCVEKGFEYAGLHSFVMPENYIAMYDAPDKKQSEEIIHKATPRIFDTAKAIQEGQQLSQETRKFSDNLKSNLVNPVFYSLVVKAKGFYTTDVCNGCGKCVKACPLNNIKLVDQNPVWGDQCTHCMACICRCPTEAIEYKKASQGRYRYYNKGYESIKF